MKIGIIGGTFDPIHLGHLRIAEQASAEFRLDEVWFMPAGDPYFKEQLKVTPANIRLEMTKLCILDTNKNYQVSDIEVLRKGKTYTSDTLTELCYKYPEHDFYFIIGLDSLFQLHKWHRPDIILDSAVILCAARDDYIDEDITKSIDTLKKLYPHTKCNIRILHSNKIDISSTKIREAVKAGIDIKPYVTKSVFEYINQHGLYI
ncbi:MAG: nicotinate-nucleotide adenylyltransferase [Eubacteriales bacterium]|nr:nicotinate-nucleotide adenylyltransferase [Eubacteriales bacterium]